MPGPDNPRFLYDSEGNASTIAANAGSAYEHDRLHDGGSVDILSQKILSPSQFWEADNYLSETILQEDKVAHDHEGPLDASAATRKADLDFASSAARYNTDVASLVPSDQANYVSASAAAHKADVTASEDDKLVDEFEQLETNTIGRAVQRDLDGILSRPNPDDDVSSADAMASHLQSETNRLVTSEASFTSSDITKGSDFAMEASDAFKKDVSDAQHLDAEGQRAAEYRDIAHSARYFPSNAPQSPESLSSAEGEAADIYHTDADKLFSDAEHDQDLVYSLLSHIKSPSETPHSDATHDNQNAADNEDSADYADRYVRTANSYLSDDDHDLHEHDYGYPDESHLKSDVQRHLGSDHLFITEIQIDASEAFNDNKEALSDYDIAAAQSDADAFRHDLSDEGRISSDIISENAIDARMHLNPQDGSQASLDGHEAVSDYGLVKSADRATSDDASHLAEDKTIDNYTDRDQDDLDTLRDASDHLKADENYYSRITADMGHVEADFKQAVYDGDRRAAKNEQNDLTKEIGYQNEINSDWATEKDIINQVDNDLHHVPSVQALRQDSSDVAADERDATRDDQKRIDADQAWDRENARWSSDSERAKTANTFKSDNALKEKVNLDLTRASDDIAQDQESVEQIGHDAAKTSDDFTRITHHGVQAAKGTDLVDDMHAANKEIPSFNREQHDENEINSDIARESNAIVQLDQILGYSPSEIPSDHKHDARDAKNSRVDDAGVQQANAYLSDDQHASAQTTGHNQQDHVEQAHISDQAIDHLNWDQHLSSQISSDIHQAEQALESAQANQDNISVGKENHFLNDDYTDRGQLHQDIYGEKDVIEAMRADLNILPSEGPGDSAHASEMSASALRDNENAQQADNYKDDDQLIKKDFAHDPDSLATLQRKVSLHLNEDKRYLGQAGSDESKALNYYNEAMESGDPSAARNDLSALNSEMSDTGRITNDESEENKIINEIDLSKNSPQKFEKDGSHTASDDSSALRDDMDAYRADTYYAEDSDISNYYTSGSKQQGHVAALVSQHLGDDQYFDSQIKGDIETSLDDYQMAAGSEDNASAALIHSDLDKEMADDSRVQSDIVSENQLLNHLNQPDIKPTELPKDTSDATHNGDSARRDDLNAFQADAYRMEDDNDATHYANGTAQRQSIDAQAQDHLHTDQRFYTTASDDIKQSINDYQTSVKNGDIVSAGSDLSAFNGEMADEGRITADINNEHQIIDGMAPQAGGPGFGGNNQDDAFAMANESFAQGNWSAVEASSDYLRDDRDSVQSLENDPHAQQSVMDTIDDHESEDQRYMQWTKNASKEASQDLKQAKKDHDDAAVDRDHNAMKTDKEDYNEIKHNLQGEKALGKQLSGDSGGDNDNGGGSHNGGGGNSHHHHHQTHHDNNGGGSNDDNGGSNSNGGNSPTPGGHGGNANGGSSNGGNGGDNFPSGDGSSTPWNQVQNLENQVNPEINALVKNVYENPDDASTGRNHVPYGIINNEGGSFNPDPMIGPSGQVGHLENDMAAAHNGILSMQDDPGRYHPTEYQQAQNTITQDYDQLMDLEYQGDKDQAQYGGIDEQYKGLCFTTGTQILTAQGEKPVEELRVGDTAITSRGERKMINWIGHQDMLFGMKSEHPVVIRAHAVDRGVPSRDLMVSAAHGLAFTLMMRNIFGRKKERTFLARASSLVNGRSIVTSQVPRATYWHIELAGGHDVLLANNMPAESFADHGEREFFSQVAASKLGKVAFGDCFPRYKRGRPIRVVRSLLDSRAQLFTSTKRHYFVAS